VQEFRYRVRFNELFRTVYYTMNFGLLLNFVRYEIVIKLQSKCSNIIDIVYSFRRRVGVLSLGEGEWTTESKE